MLRRNPQIASNLRQEKMAAETAGLGRQARNTVGNGKSTPSSVCRLLRQP
jgi:DNA-binding XRE family transcriptional regulator